MSQALATTNGHDITATHPGEDLDDFVTFHIADQMFGIPVLKVQDILQPEYIASIPLAPPDVKGSINLRGRIEHGHDLYTLLVDRIGDVMGLSGDNFERNPATLDPKWREFSVGVYRLEKKLLVVLDIERLLNLSKWDGKP
jgi:purine-binding chemotaxis protein CheW